MTAIHCPPVVTGTVGTAACLSNPRFNALGSLKMTDSLALWSGCLDANDHIHCGSHTNLKSAFSEGYLVYSEFNFRP